MEFGYTGVIAVYFPVKSGHATIVGICLPGAAERIQTGFVAINLVELVGQALLLVLIWDFSDASCASSAFIWFVRLVNSP